MQDLAEAIWKALIGYLPRLFAVIGAPRTNVPRLVAEPRDPLKDGLVFLAITVGITFILQAPLLADDLDFVTAGSTLFAIKLAAMAAFNGALLLAFKAVGGRGSFTDTLVASFYIIAPPSLFVVLARLLTLGLTVDAPEIRDVFLGLGPADDAAFEAFIVAQPGQATLLAILSLLLLFGPILWFIHCWRIYRDIHGLTRARSIAAYVIAFLLFILVGYLEQAMTLGSFGGRDPGFL